MIGKNGAGAKFLPFAGWYCLAVAPTLAKCPNCGEWYVYHTVCPACGYYRGKLAIEQEVAE